MASENFEEAISLKISNFPKSFFKYRALSQRTIESVEQNYIWLADISTLNDPFECSIQFDNDKCWREYYSSETFEESFKKWTGQTLTSKELKLLRKSPKPFDVYLEICKKRNIPFGLTSEEQLKRVRKRWAEMIEEMSKNLRICSFSLINSSLLLWSHYSEEHKGIAIEYDFEDTDSIRTYMQPIVYREKVHKIGLLDDYTPMQLISSSLIKSKDWEYEKEWRLTIFKQKGVFPHVMTTPNPKAIYLGTRFGMNPENLKSELIRIAKEREIPLYQMEKDPQEFRLIAKNTFAKTGS